jgi:hypothetical protein
MKTFFLTLNYQNSKSIGPVKKTFDTSHVKRAWGLAKRWANNCQAICGRHPETNEMASGWELVIEKEVR